MNPTEDLKLLREVSLPALRRAVEESRSRGLPVECLEFILELRTRIDDLEQIIKRSVPRGLQ